MIQQPSFGLPRASVRMEMGVVIVGRIESGGTNDQLALETSLKLSMQAFLGCPLTFKKTSENRFSLWSFLIEMNL